MSKIIIVEDDRTLRNECKILLNKHGYEVAVLENFEDVSEQVLKSDADLVLLDINLPYKSGEQCCREIRSNSNIAIIMLTSSNNEMDELLSMSYGADDYVTKPYNPLILLVRIEAVLKRLNPSDNQHLNYRGMSLNMALGSITYQDKCLELSKNELRILTYFFMNPQQIITRVAIMDYLWGNEEFVDDNTLSVNINRIRKKLAELGFEDIIETRRAQGYIFK